MHPKHFEEMIDLGVTWHRPHPGPFNWGSIENSPGVFDWDEADFEVIHSQYYGFNIIATIWPFADWDQEVCNDALSSSQTQMFSELGSYRNKPCDMTAYKNFVKSLVERYDGDGVDDMPDLVVPIKYWEVSNEPSMQEDLVFFSGSSSDYYDILNLSLMIIRFTNINFNTLGGISIGPFVVDMEKVFEEYISRLVSSLSSVNIHSVQIQVPFPLFEGNSLNLIRPDIVINSQKPPIIIDVKYKLRPDVSDFYQIITYVHRHESEIGILVYPRYEEEQNTCEEIFRNKKIIIYYYDLMKPRESEEQFSDFITKLVN